MNEITRSHIAKKVMSAFRSGPADRQMILDEAKSQGAESGVIRTLQRLPDRRYKSVRDLWEHLPELPIGV